MILHNLTIVVIFLYKPRIVIIINALIYIILINSLNILIGTFSSIFIFYYFNFNFFSVMDLLKIDSILLEKYHLFRYSGQIIIGIK